RFFDDLRRQLDAEHLIATPHAELQRLVEIEHDMALDLVEAFDLGPVNAGDLVTDLQACLGGGATGCHFGDLGRLQRLAEAGEDDGHDDDSEHKIRDRPGGNDGGTAPYTLGIKGNGTLFRRHCCTGGTFQHIAFLAEHADIAAQGNGTDPPARTMTIRAADQFRTKADGKHLDPYATPAGDEEMPHLMHENQDRQKQQEPEAVLRYRRQNLHCSRSPLLPAPRRPSGRPISLGENGPPATSPATTRPAEGRPARSSTLYRAGTLKQ